LALAWATRSGARLIDPSHIDVARLPAGPALLENADRFIADTALFHLINRAEAEGGLLLTARSAPRAWTTSLPDLRSRLNALPTAELGVADDAVLEGVLRRFFRDRNIRPDEDLIPYLLHRMERSVPAALAMVARLDEAADASRRGVTRALAREILETLDNGSDPRA
jgi:chromosomal replication initiation ATPase DnaA